jgi:hypothetical protein
MSALNLICIYPCKSPTYVNRFIQAMMDGNLWFYVDSDVRKLLGMEDGSLVTLDEFTGSPELQRIVNDVLSFVGNTAMPPFPIKRYKKYNSHYSDVAFTTLERDFVFEGIQPHFGEFSMLLKFYK